MLVKGISNGELKFNEEGTLPMEIFRKMFELNLFKEIKSCEMDILKTIEYDHLNDYDNLDYIPELCMELIYSDNDYKKEKKRARIYYSDFKNDNTESPKCSIRLRPGELRSMIIKSTSFFEK